MLLIIKTIFFINYFNHTAYCWTFFKGYNFITPRHRRAGVGANSSPDLPPAYDNVVALEDAEDTEERPVNKVEETPPPAYQDVIRIEDEIKQQWINRRLSLRWLL